MRKFYDNAVCQVGVFREIRLDKGSEFNAEVMAHLATMLGFQQRFSAGYSSFCQHKAEKLVQNISNAIRCMIQEKGSIWTSFLQSMVFVLNTAMLDANIYLSPFLLQYGQLPRFPCEASLQPHLEECESWKEHIPLQHENFKQVHEIMR